MKKPKPIKLSVLCPNCDYLNHVPWDKIDFYSHYDECDLCGSHGETQMDFIGISCEICNTKFGSIVVEAK